jgi:transposase
MPNNRLSMRQIKEVLRLYYECQRSQRDIAEVVGASRSTVWDYLHRARLAQLTYEQAMQLDEAALDARLFPPVPASRVARPMPDWPLVHRELGKKNVTLDLLWNEYKAQEPDGYGYSWFCKHYEQWAAALPVTLRQTHVPGEKLFIDYSGNRLGIVDPHTGEIREAELFVATLGASNTYAEVTWTQQLQDWIGSHVRAFNFFGGCVEILVPDNLKSGVHKADFYDPVLNRTYGEMASHYSVAIIPARSRRPRDKAKSRTIGAPGTALDSGASAQQRLFSLEEANRAIAALLVVLNNKPFKKLPGCRRSAFEELDRPALRPLPERPYQYAQWKVARAGIDLPRRSRPALLLGVVLPRTRAGRRALHHDDRRDLPSRATHRRACEERSPWTPQHDHRTHAAESSGGHHRVEPATPDQLGGGHRPAYRRRHRTPAGRSPAPAAGLPRLPGRAAHG